MRQNDFRAFLERFEQLRLDILFNTVCGKDSRWRGRRVHGSDAQGICRAQDAIRLAQSLFKNVLWQARGDGFGQFGITRGVAKALQHFRCGDLSGLQQAGGCIGGRYIAQRFGRCRPAVAACRAPDITEIKRA